MPTPKDRTGECPRDPTAEPWRRLVIYLILLGIAGAGADLLLIAHYEDALQWTPLALLAAGAASTALLGWRPTPRGLRTQKVVMGTYLVAGAVGAALHFKANAEFQLELRPTLEGLDLVRRAVRGIPILAPGAMVQLGLLGLLACYRHPVARATAEPSTHGLSEE